MFKVVYMYKKACFESDEDFKKQYSKKLDSLTLEKYIKDTEENNFLLDYMDDYLQQFVINEETKDFYYVEDFFEQTKVFSFKET